MVLRAVCFSIAIAFLVQACGVGGEDDRRAEWTKVQALRKAYEEAEPDARSEAKQKWADGVREFLRRWPDHAGAIRTWNDLQLDYAMQLEANGRYREAEVHYRYLVEQNPANVPAEEGLSRVARRLALSRREFESIEKGMTQSEVARWIGLPRPGWERRETGGDVLVESWYYRSTDGRIRGVHFRDGAVYAIDLD